MSKHTHTHKTQNIIHYVKPTAQLLLKFDFQKVDRTNMQEATG